MNPHLRRFECTAIHINQLPLQRLLRSLTTNRNAIALHQLHFLSMLSQTSHGLARRGDEMSARA